MLDGRGRAQRAALSGLNPFAFRASAEQYPSDIITRLAGLNPFAFRASAEPLRGQGYRIRDLVSIPLLSGPVLNDQPQRARNGIEVSIPLLSGPVLNGLSRRVELYRLSQSLCFQGQC